MLRRERSEPRSTHAAAARHRARRRRQRLALRRVGPALALGAWTGLIGLALYACTTTPPPSPEAATYRPSDYADLPGWTADRQAEALPALRRS